MSQSVPVQMAFALYTDKEGLDASLPSAAPAANRVWTSWVSTEGEDATVTPGSHSDNVVDDTISVAVRNGRFLIHLGEALADDAENTQVEIPDSVFNNTPLFVVSWVAQENDNGGFNLFRLPPQRLDTVPHAVTAKQARDFEVKGELRVRGRLISHQPEPPNQGAALVTIVNHGVEGQGDNNTHLGYSTSDGLSKNYIRGDETIISSPTKFERSIESNGDMNVRNLTVTGQLQYQHMRGNNNVVGLSNSECSEYLVGCNGHQCGVTYHHILCPPGWYMRGFGYMSHGSYAGYNHKIYCCRP